MNMSDGMTTDEIELILKTEPIVKHIFVGVFAINELRVAPKQRPCAYVVNTDPISKPGKHWVAIYLTRTMEGEYFGSFGIPPVQPKFRKFLDKNAPEGWLYNDESIQHPFSTVCGEYCVFYLLYRCRGTSMATIVRMFDENNQEDNDILVKDFVDAL